MSRIESSNKDKTQDKIVRRDGIRLLVKLLDFQVRSAGEITPTQRKQILSAVKDCEIEDINALRFLGDPLIFYFIWTFSAGVISSLHTELNLDLNVQSSKGVSALDCAQGLLSEMLEDYKEDSDYVVCLREIITLLQ